MLADVRLAFRGLLAHPGFSVGVVLTLGLGIGASTAIFPAMHALLLRPQEIIIVSDEEGRTYIVNCGWGDGAPRRLHSLGGQLATGRPRVAP